MGLCVGFGYSQVSPQTPAAPAAPAPRDAKGRVILGTLPGERALWFPAGGGGERLVAEDTETPPPGKLRISEVPFQPWARLIYWDRDENRHEPHTRCKPSGGPRQFLTPYGVEFVEMPELERIYIMDIGGPHTFRIIYMNGKHPDDPAPSYYGHSTGRWEKDTLVVDTIGFNEKFWMDRQGITHTGKLHMVERFTRTDYNTIQYSMSADDPGAYTEPWTSGFNLRWTPNQELFEYICQENNLAGELLVGTYSSVDRRSVIVP